MNSAGAQSNSSFAAATTFEPIGGRIYRVGGLADYYAYSTGGDHRLAVSVSMNGVEIAAFERVTTNRIGPLEFAEDVDVPMACGTLTIAVSYDGRANDDGYVNEVSASIDYDEGDVMFGGLM